MKKLSFVLFLSGIAFCSCNKEPQARPLTKQEIAKKADSIATYKMKEQDERSRTDLEYRIKIEVKAKVDSIVTARIQQAAKDTTIKK